MAIYIVPNVGDFQELSDLLKPSGVPFLIPKKLRELIVAEVDKPIIVVALSVSDMMVLTRNASTLLNEAPTVLVSAPGPVYDGEWVSMATAFPPIDWLEFKGKVSKSGHLSLNPEELEKRSPATQDHDVQPSTSPRPPFARTRATQQTQAPVSLREEEDPDAAVFS
jgi:hypothetical protein